MSKVYNVLLEGNKIGTTILEDADAPMGVVSGEISFTDETIDYKFWHNYCLAHKIETSADYPEDTLIATMHIEALKVFNEEGVEIKGVSCSIEGMDTDGFQVVILGVPYPFYNQEFPEHVKAHNSLN